MPFKSKFRKALTRSSTTTRSNSTASTLSTTQTSPSSPTIPSSPTLTTAPTITLTKTSSRYSLTKKLTWGRGDKAEKERKERKKREEEWEEFDRNFIYKPGKRVNAERLRGWEWKFRGSFEGRRGSQWSGVGVSPGQSRVGSLDLGEGVGVGAKRGSGAGLERVRSSGAVGVGEVIAE